MGLDLVLLQIAIVDGPSELNHFYTFRHPSAYIDVQTVTSEHTSKFIMQGALFPSAQCAVDL